MNRRRVMGKLVWEILIVLVFSVFNACGTGDSASDSGLDGDGFSDEGIAGGDDGGSEDGFDAGSDLEADGSGSDPGPDGTVDADGFPADRDQDGGVDAGQDAGSDPGPGDMGGDNDTGAELIIEQIACPTFMGESALIVGPDGTSVIIDTGGSGHDDEILAAIDRYLPERKVDWVVVTHYHADHTGEFDTLFTSADDGSRPVVVERGVISRGLLDIDGQFMADDAALREYCGEVTAGPWASKRFDLCEGPQEASCDGSGAGDPWPASSCSGLILGDLTDPEDDQDGHLSYLELGEGARLVFYHANGYLATGTGVISAEDSGLNIGHGGTAPENGRSLGGIVRWGNFAYTFHGDLTGEMERFISARAGQIMEYPGGPLLVPDGLLDVAKLSHHGLVSSTSQEWVDWLFPADATNRNAVVGTNTGYFFSPSATVMERLGPRLGAGFVWVTLLGTLPGDHALRRVAEGSVVVKVLSAGSEYQMYAQTESGQQMPESYSSTIP